MSMEMTGEKIPEHRQRESDADRLRRTITPEAMSIELVSAFAGDRDMTKGDAERLRTQQIERGRLFFSDLLYTISHHYFAPRVAEDLWREISLHKERMARCLERDVGIVVATLDYLSNITNELLDLTLISEGHISKIAALAMRDRMTGLFNHSACHELLDLELRNRRRYGFGISVLLLDIDDFKSINDLNGHQRGDRVLAGLAETLVAAARDSDICCRLGGDEFVLILRLINDPLEAHALAERIRERVAVTSFDGHQITISIGIALCEHAATSSHQLLERADRALYRAKAGGKNQVALACDLGQGPDAGVGASVGATVGPALADLHREPERALEPIKDQQALAGWEDEGGTVGTEIPAGRERRRPVAGSTRGRPGDAESRPTHRYG